MSLNKITGLLAGAFCLPIVSVSVTSTSAWSQINEVIVTARKREENLQDVPIAITAFGEEDIARKQIRELEDVALLTPGLVFEDFFNGTVGTPTIRGLAQTDITSPLPNTSTFVDGLYLQRPYSVDVGLIDLARIEVVKGPQSALYGRNAFAGAINYVTKRPSEVFEVSGAVTYGSDDRIDYRGRLDIPIVEDKLAVGVSYGHTEFDGSWDNNFPGASGDLKKVGGWDNESYAVQALITPWQGIEIDLDYYRTERSAEPNAAYNISDKFTHLSANCGTNNVLVCGELSSDPLTYVTPGEFRVPGISIIDEANFSDTDTDIFRAALSWDVTDALTLKYQFGRVEVESFSITTTTDTVTGNLAGGRSSFSVGPGGINETDSHEVRLEFDNEGPFQGAIGAYYSKTDDFENLNNFLFDVGNFGPVSFVGVDVGNATTLPNLPNFFDAIFNGPFRVSQFPLNVAESESIDKSIFAAGTLTFLEEKARVTLEGRYTWEDVDVTVFDTDPDFPPFFECCTDEVLSDQYSFFTPRISVDYKLTDDSMIYVSAARGVKAGGFNAGAELADELTYGEEVNWTYEVGMRNTLWQDRATFNVSAYYIDWEKMAIRRSATITTPGQPPAITDILGSSSVYGVEVAGIVAPTDNLSFNYGLSYNVPEFDDGVETTRLSVALGCDGIVCTAFDNGTGRLAADVGGNTIARTSKFQAVLGAQWEDQLPNTPLDYYIRADISHQSKQYVTELNLATIPARTLVNGSMALLGEGWEFQLWAKNLFDEKVAANSFYVEGNEPPHLIVGLNSRRTFGGTLNFSF